jgi:hypothetical protein
MEEHESRIQPSPQVVEDLRLPTSVDRERVFDGALRNCHDGVPNEHDRRAAFRVENPLLEAEEAGAVVLHAETTEVEWKRLGLPRLDIGNVVAGIATGMPEHAAVLDVGD